MVFPFTNCGLCRPTLRDEAEGGGSGGSASQKHEAGGPTQPVSVPQMLRSKSEARILQQNIGVEAGGAAGMNRSQSMPSSSLLEASRRRLAAATAAEAAALAEKQLVNDGAAAQQFVQQYMQAIKDGNASWASAPEVGSLFTDDARLVSVDRQSFQGRGAIVRRLNQGVEQLARMAGDQPELPTFELAEPQVVTGGALLLRLTLKRGMHKMGFAMTFTMRGGKISNLVNARN